MMNTETISVVAVYPPAQLHSTNDRNVIVSCSSHDKTAYATACYYVTIQPNHVLQKSVKRFEPKSVVTKAQLRFNSPHVTLYQQLTVPAVLLLLVSLSHWHVK